MSMEADRRYFLITIQVTPSYTQPHLETLVVPETPMQLLARHKAAREESIRINRPMIGCMVDPLCVVFAMEISEDEWASCATPMKEFRP